MAGDPCEELSPTGEKKERTKLCVVVKIAAFFLHKITVSSLQIGRYQNVPMKTMCYL